MKMSSIMMGLILTAAMIGPMANVAAAESTEMPEYKNGGYVLPVPEEYDSLIRVELPEDDPDGTLFSITEIASADAAKAKGIEDAGLGFVGSIARITEEELQDLLCGDMSGMDVIAADQEGNYFLFCHPTDVRIEFAEGADMDAAMKQFSELNEWASGKMCEDFIEANEGLEEKHFSNSSLDIVLAQIAYKDFRDYTLSTLEFGPAEPGDVDPASFLKRMEGMKLDYTDEEAPDGEYCVLNLPEENRRFDFFPGEESQNLVREVITLEDGDEITVMYQAVFPEEGETISKVMNDWYQALVEANGGAFQEK